MPKYQLFTTVFSQHGCIVKKDDSINSMDYGNKCNKQVMLTDESKT